MAFFVFFAAFLCLLFSGFDVVEGNPYITVKYNQMVDPSVVYLDDDSVELACNYFISSNNAASYGDAEWVKVEDQQTVVLSSTSPVPAGNYRKEIYVTVTSVGTYSCRYPNETSFAVTVAVKHGTVTTGPTTKPSTAPPTGSHAAPPDHTSSVPTSDGSTSATGTDDTTPTNFKALNPVIYTVVSAAILGTLTIVAIVTCWLRSRKNVHLQTLLPRNSPQDYLDFIQENEFTPMTTSEFLASLQERPPTYNESETIERQKREDNSEGEGEGGGQGQPPPLPPRNNPRRSGTRPPGSSSSTRPGSSQSQLSTSSGDHNTSSSLSSTAARQQGRTSSDSQGGQVGLSADLHMDAVIAAFVESIEILEAQRAAMTSQRDEATEEDESSALNSSETSALLGGVAPSLDAVV